MKKEIEIINKNYNFSYTDIQYDINIINPRLEMNRKMEMLNIISKFKSILTKYKIKHKTEDIYNVINRYIFYYFSQVKYSFIDPVFPYIKNKNKYLLLLQENIKYIFKTNKEKEIANELQLNILFIKAIENIKNIKNIKNINKISFEKKIDKTFIHYTSKINEIFSYKIPISIYKKLEKDYLNYKELYFHNYKLDNLIYCLLIRYNTLFSRGNQWAMPIKIKEEFKKKFNINFEMFASSFNHYYDFYCSLFYDIEKYFMSIGYFQNVKYIKGFYMANPPYEEKLLYKMYNISEKSFINNKNNLTFIMGTPSWEKYYFELHDIIKNSIYYKYSYKIKDKEVEWYDFIENKYMKIPSNIRYILTNNNKLDIKNIIHIMDKFWTKRI